MRPLVATEAELVARADVIVKGTLYGRGLFTAKSRGPGALMRPTFPFPRRKHGRRL